MGQETVLGCGEFYGYRVLAELGGVLVVVSEGMDCFHNLMHPKILYFSVNI